MAGNDATEQVELSRIRAASRRVPWVPRPWRFPAAVILFSLAMALLLLRSTVASAYLTWRTDQTYSHGILILPIVIFLVYLRRKQLAQLQPAPAYWGLILLGLFGIAWLLGNIGEVFLVQQLAAIAILDALVLTVLGTQVARALLFPLAFMVFAVPFGDGVVGPLQDLTAWFATNALQWSGVPVLLEGRTISVPSGTWEVAEACSGARYLIASIVLASLFAAFGYRLWWRRVVFVTAAIVVAIIANCLRAYTIILLGERVSRRLAGGIAHTFYGWVIFSLVIAGVFWLGSRWREPMQSGAMVEAVPAVRKPDPASSVGMVVAAFLGVVVLVSIVTAAAWLRRQPALRGTPDLTAPVPASPWVFSSRYDAGWVSTSVHAAREVVQAYENDNQRVYLFIGDYSGQRLDTFNSGDRLLNHARWSRARERARPITVDGHLVNIREMVAQSVSSPIGGLRLVWSWYRVGGVFTADPYYAKFLQAKQRLLGGPSASTVIVIAADYQFDISVAEHALQDFLAHCSLAPAL